MNNQLLNRFMNDKVAVHVSTQEQCTKFMKFLEDNTDKIWSTGEKPTKFDGWYIYGTDTVIYGGGILVGGNRLTFGDMKNAKCYGYTVIEFSDLMKEERN